MFWWYFIRLEVFPRYYLVCLSEVIIVRIDNTFGLGLECLSSISGPPNFLDSKSVITGADLVKGMNNFMSQNGPKGAVIHGRGVVEVIEGILENSGGEDDFVRLEGVVGLGALGRVLPIVFSIWQPQPVYTKNIFYFFCALKD